MRFGLFFKSFYSVYIYSNVASEHGFGKKKHATHLHFQVDTPHASTNFATFAVASPHSSCIHAPIARNPRLRSPTSASRCSPAGFASQAFPRAGSIGCAHADSRATDRRLQNSFMGRLRSGALPSPPIAGAMLVRGHSSLQSRAGARKIHDRPHRRHGGGLCLLGRGL